MATQAAKPEQWTAEQWQAITERGQNLLVAAAAGSGKTSVLVERIIRRITDADDPIGVDQLLVVTFTNAAAAEMRHRIGEALKKALETEPASAHLRRQLALLQRATITTLHSFCLGLLRQYAYVVGLDPEFRIADPLEADLLRQDVLEAKMEEWYADDADFLALADAMLDGQDDAMLAALLLRLYEFSRSHPQPGEWLKQAAAMFEVEEDQPLAALPWTGRLLAAVRLELQSVVARLQKAADIAASPDGPAAYLPLLEKERQAVIDAWAACETGWEAAEQAIRAISFGRLPSVKDADPACKEQVQVLRNAAKEGIGSLIEAYFSMDASVCLRDLRAVAPLMNTLARLVGEFEAAYRQEKQARSLVDFGDLEHLALSILLEPDEAGGFRPSAVARQLREQFVEVLVDEYQDINLVQETILWAVSRDGGSGWPNRFMVGDVKQSIYRFRLAEPHLFLAKYGAYKRLNSADGGDVGRPDAGTHALSGGNAADSHTRSSAENGLRIDLAANFRSRREVVDAVNYLFRQIMSPGVGEMAYDKSAELVAQADYPEIEPQLLDVEVHLIDRSGGEESSAAQEGTPAAETRADTADVSDGRTMQGDSLAEETSVAQLEARLIARRIRQWMEPGEGGKPLMVYDKKQKTMRPLAYRDIVILLRATAGWAQPMIEEFRAAGIPVYVDQNDGYFAATEVEVVLSLLRVIDNPLQDIPLAAVLRSPIVGLSEPELAEIRIFHPTGPFHQAVRAFVEHHRSHRSGWIGRLVRFFWQVEEWRTQARQGPLAELIARIYRDTGYADYVAALENGTQRQANLRALYDRARQYEARAYRGLFRFLRFVDRLKETGGDMGEARTIGEGENVVRLMTIHKSKGLEFPVVFVAGMGKSFNMLDLRGPFLLHKELGFGPQVTDRELRQRYPSLAYLGIRQQLRREMLAEEMRVLYVALTRAKEKLLLVGSAKDLAKAAARWCDQTGSGETLADEDLIRAKSYLDWVGPALARHPAGAPLRELAESTGAVTSVRMIPDESRWAFSFYRDDELGAQTADAGCDETVWERVVRLQPVDGRPDGESWRELVERRLEWRYPGERATEIAAKWSVSELKRVSQEAAEAAVWSPAGKRSLHLPRITERPRFLAEADAASAATGSDRRAASFTPAEIGTIVHTVMQHLDIEATRDEADIRRQLDILIARQLLTAEQAAQVDAGAILRFFASDLGGRMRQSFRRYRELPFTAAIPANDIFPGAPELTDERVLVQGVIDCMWEEADGRLVLVDFKTDAVAGEPTAEAIERLADRYREQIRLYARAVQAIWKRPVDECYLYFFAAGAAVPVTIE